MIAPGEVVTVNPFRPHRRLPWRRSLDRPLRPAEAARVLREAERVQDAERAAAFERLFELARRS